MFADIVTFSEGSDASADNIQGKVYIWDDEIEEYVLAGAGETVYVYLYYDGGEIIFDSGSDVTDSNSWYSYNFDDSGSNCNYCDIVKVSYKGRLYQASYDGIVRINIYWDPINGGPGNNE